MTIHIRSLPETAVARPSSAFSLSLYSLLRDNVLPIAVKAVPQGTAFEFAGLFLRFEADEEHNAHERIVIVDKSVRINSH